MSFYFGFILANLSQKQLLFSNYAPSILPIPVMGMKVDDDHTRE